MAKLDNSTRRLPQAVYAQVKLQDKGGQFHSQRPLLKAGFITPMRPTPQETATIKRRLVRERSQANADRAPIDAVLAAVAAVESVALARGRPDPTRFAAAFAAV